jgi:4-amino-4-deoxy-L-arabinose transferase-like glycosyltransferase
MAVLLVWIMVRPLGLWPALLAALLLAMAPAAVYYSRYFIQETLLVTFTLGAFVCGRAWWDRRGLGWAVGTGVCLGLMLATKANALVCVVAACLALAACRRMERTPWREVAIVGAVSAFVAAAFYSSFGGNWGGVRDALVTPFTMLGRVAGGESGHEKPWWYYLRLFVYQKQGGYVWDESLLLLPALVGAVLGWRRGGLPRFIAVYTGVMVAVFSLAPYKTPWQVINFVPGICILAAIALSSVRRWVAIPLALIVVAGLGWQMRQAVYLRPADERNPFAYVHTVPDMLKVPAIAAAVPAGVVKVIGREYWPLPWYLRARPVVGFWTEPPVDCDGVLVFVEADQADAVRARLQGKYTESFLGLRPGVLVVVFTRVGA